MKKAEASIAAPEAQRTADRSGVQDGNYWFVE